MKAQAGFSLTELIIVIAVIAIVLSIATLDFGKMQKKGQTEKQIRQMFADVEHARQTAMFSKRPTAVLLQPDSYVFKQYSSENEDPAAGAELSKQKVSYLLTAADGSSIAGETAVFDKRGAVGSEITLKANPSESGASVDCIVIGILRTGMGKIESDKCILK